MGLPNELGTCSLNIANIYSPLTYFDMRTLFSFFLTLIFSFNSYGQIDPGDLEVLRVLYGFTGGPNWNVQWDFTEPVDSLSGVRYDTLTGRVEELMLNSFGLTGELPEQISDLDSLKVLGLFDNNLSSVEGIESLVKLEVISLGRNQLTEIPDLSQLSLLSILEIRENRGLENIPNLNPTSLTNLNFNGCSISILPDLSSFTSLLEISGIGNRITDISTLFELTQLEEIDFRGNQISSVEGIENLGELFELLLGANELSSIDGIDNLIGLTILDLGRNNISSIEGIQNLVNLRNLELDSLSINSFSVISELDNLERLSINTCGIPSLEGIENLQNLQTLSAFNNRLDNIEGLEQLSNLTFIDLQSNLLSDEDISPLSALDSITNFYIGLNDSITQLPDLSGSISTLRDLRFQSCNISKLPDLSPFTMLNRLAGWNNQIRTIPGLEALENLVVIDMRQNELISVDGLENLPNLVTIWIHTNALQTIPNFTSSRIGNIAIQANYLSFSQLEKLLPFIRDSSVFVSYLRQNNFGAQQFIGVYQDSGFSIGIQDPSPNDSYQWYKDGILISGATNATYESIASTDDEGVYYVEVTNDSFPGLTLRSQDKTLNVYPFSTVPDYFAEDTLPNTRKVVISYPELSELETDRIEEIRDSVKQVFRQWGSVLLDSCLCGTLEVWTLPDTLTEIVDSGLVRQYIGPEEGVAHSNPKTRQNEDPIIQVVWSQPLNLGLADSAATPYRVEFQVDSTEELASVVVAIVDFGVDKTHPALENNIYQNPTPGAYCSDLLDDTQGYNAITEDGNAFKDVNGHGTHIANIIVNLIENKELDLLSIQVSDNVDTTRVFEVACGMKYAIQAGAKVINLSLGYYGAESLLLRKLMEEAEENDVIVVTSAGNDFQDNDQIAHWPSNYSYPNHIAVGASNDDGQLAIFSNYGDTTVSLLAPGWGIFSALPDGKYGSKSGTSMAAGFVTAVAAYLCALHPELSADSIVQLLLSEEFNGLRPSLVDSVNSAGELKVDLFNCEETPFARNDRFSIVDFNTDTLAVWQNDCFGQGVVLDIIQAPEYLQAIPYKDSVKNWVEISWNDSLLTSSGVDSIQYQLIGLPSNDEESERDTAWLVLDRRVTSTFSIPQLGNLVVFPNPASHNLYLSGNLDTPLPLSFHLRDLQGRIVKKLDLNHFSRNKTYSIPLNGLAPGLYMYSIQVGTHTLVDKLIVQ